MSSFIYTIFKGHTFNLVKFLRTKRISCEEKTYKLFGYDDEKLINVCAEIEKLDKKIGELPE